MLFPDQSSLIIFCCFQSMALQDGCCKKIDLERIEPTLESTADSHVAESQLGLTSGERSSSLREPNAYDHGLLCHAGIHARGSSFSNRLPRSLKKQCKNTTGSFNFNFIMHLGYSFGYIMILSITCLLLHLVVYMPVICMLMFFFLHSHSLTKQALTLSSSPCSVILSSKSMGLLSF